MSGIGCWSLPRIQHFSRGEEPKGVFQEEVNRLSSAAETMSGVNRNLAPDGCTFGIKQAEQTWRHKGRHHARRRAFACLSPDEACPNLLVNRHLLGSFMSSFCNRCDDMFICSAVRVFESLFKVPPHHVYARVVKWMCTTESWTNKFFTTATVSKSLDLAFKSKNVPNKSRLT